MIRRGRASQVPKAVSHSWLVAMVAAGLAFVGNIAAIMMRSDVYGNETRVLFDAAIAQDLVTAAVAVPVVVLLAGPAMAGSVRAHLAGLGAMAFLAYNYVIYCFSISFGQLFLLWTAVLGLSVYALGAGIIGATQLDVHRVVRPTRLAAWVLIGVAVLFAGLWLAEIVPDSLEGGPSTSAVEWRVPTNPVHVLDLAFLLPAAFVAGLRLRVKSNGALIAAPGVLVVFFLTSLPILLTPVVASVRHGTAEWGAFGPVAIIAGLAAAALRSLVMRDSEGESSPSPIARTGDTDQ